MIWSEPHKRCMDGQELRGLVTSCDRAGLACLAGVMVVSHPATMIFRALIRLLFVCGGGPVLFGRC